jgi:nicotinamidase-related amidase
VNNDHGTGPSTKKRILKFHNKGRNNLVEMYSVFSSDKPITARETLKLKKFAYDGEGHPTFEYNSTGHQTYESHSNNMNTDLNVPLIQHLLRNNNRVYFCGEARTHCVKSTLMDVMDVVESSRDMYDPANVVLLKNMSSPISKAHHTRLFREPSSNGMKK